MNRPAMASVAGQRLIGACMVVGCVAFVAYLWQQAIVQGVYWPKASFFLPFGAFLGLAVLLFPMSREECMARFSVERPSRWSHMPAGAKVLVSLGTLAGILNWAAISGRI